MPSATTLRDLITAHAARVTLEMEHCAPVNHHVQYNKNRNYNEVRDSSTPYIKYFSIHITLFIYRGRSAKIRQGTQREYSSTPLKHNIVKCILVFKR